MLHAKKVLVPKDIVAFVQKDIMGTIVNWVRKNDYYTHSWRLRDVLLICNYSLVFIHPAYLPKFEPFYIVGGWEGGGGTGASDPPASRILLSRFPYLYLPPPALFRIAAVPCKFAESKHILVI